MHTLQQGVDPAQTLAGPCHSYRLWQYLGREVSAEEVSTETNPVLCLGQIELIAHCQWHNLDEWWVQSIRSVSLVWVWVRGRGGVQPTLCMAASRDPISLHLLTTPILLYKQWSDPFIKGRRTERDRQTERDRKRMWRMWEDLRGQTKWGNKEMFACLVLETLAPLHMMDEPGV